MLPGRVPVGEAVPGAHRVLDPVLEDAQPVLERGVGQGHVVGHQHLAIASHKSLVTVNMTTMTREIVSTAQDLIEEAQAAFESVLGASLPVGQSVEFTRTQEDKWKAQI